MLLLPFLWAWTTLGMQFLLDNCICLTFQRKEEVFGTLLGAHTEPDSHILNLTKQIHPKNPNSGVSETAVSQQCVLAAEPAREHRGVVSVQHSKAALHHGLHIIHENNVLPTALISPISYRTRTLGTFRICRFQVCMFQSQNSIRVSLSILSQLKWPEGLQETN